MPSTNNLKVRLVFSTWNNLSDYVKSLINFYIENAQLFIKGFYSYSNNSLSLDYISGSIINSPRILDYNDAEAHSANPEQYALGIAYSSTPATDFYPVGVEDYFPDIHSTLLRVTSSLQFYHYVDTQDDYVIETNQISPITVPVTLIPLVNDVENENGNLVPTDILNDSTQFGFVNTKIEADHALSYNFQLRTASFQLRTYSYTKYIRTGTGETYYNLFYKIGLCPFDYVYNSDLSSTGNNGKTLEELKQILMKNCFGVFTIDASGISGCYYSLLNYLVLKEKDLLSCSSDNTNFPNTFILPIYRTLFIYGIAYIKLYNDDGSAFNGIGHSYSDEYIDAIENSHEINLYLGITDHHIDGGHIDNWGPTPEVIPENNSGFFGGLFIVTQPGVNAQNHTLFFNMLDTGYSDEYNGLAFVVDECWFRGGVWHYEGMLRFTNGHATSPYQDWGNIDATGPIAPYVYVNPSFMNSTILSDIFVSGDEVNVIPGFDQQGHLVFTMRDEGYAFTYNGLAFVKAKYYNSDNSSILWSYEGILEFVNGEATGPFSPYGDSLGIINSNAYINPIWSI